MMVEQTLPFEKLQARFGEQVQQNAPLARFSAARVGGPADLLVIAQSADELADAARILWDADAPYVVLGGGSNVLVSDKGVRGVVLLNKARTLKFDEIQQTVWAESGVNFGSLARQAALKGLGGLEWGAGIPGTIGGAAFGNAGAHDGDMAGNLIEADLIIAEQGRQTWPVEKFEYEYRNSVLKRNPRRALILSAQLQLQARPQEAIQEKMNKFLEHRKRTQPPGASMGSMFKNPPGDYSGRLIDVCELKGARVGDAEISSLHGNFFLNRGEATASDVYKLIQLARHAVLEKQGVELELEIELLGEWSDND
jgi:UDP-N-acetylmuramate dehydrogenase